MKIKIRELIIDTFSNDYQEHYTPIKMYLFMYFFSIIFLILHFKNYQSTDLLYLGMFLFFSFIFASNIKKRYIQGKQYYCETKTIEPSKILPLDVIEEIDLNELSLTHTFRKFNKISEN